MRFIHLADCHLATPFKFESDIGALIRDKSWESFQNIFNSNKDVDFALIAGDLFERKFVSSADFARIFDVFADFGKDIYFVTGNHDYFDDYNSIFLNNKPNNLHIFTENKLSFFEKGGVRIYGLSYKDRINSYEFPYNIDLDPAYFNILLAHADIFPNPTSYLDLDPVRLRETGFSYVGLGHIHKQGQVEGCYYPGSIEPFSFKDTGDFGYILYDNGNISHIDSALMKFYKFDIYADDYENEDEIISYINNLLTDKINFVKINLKITEPIDSKKIRREINARSCEIVEIMTDNPSHIIDLYPDSLLSRFNEKLEGLDDEISKKALELGLDAILRTKR